MLLPSSLLRLSTLKTDSVFAVETSYLACSVDVLQPLPAGVASFKGADGLDSSFITISTAGCVCNVSYKFRMLTYSDL